MQPVPHPRPLVVQERLGLRDLVDVVQFAVVDAAGVQVKVLAEQRHRHHRAFQVPAGRAPAPRRVPAHQAPDAGLLGAPEGEVAVVLAALHVLDAAGLALAREVEQGQGAVAGRLGRVEVQAGREPVGVAEFLKPDRERDHLLDVLAGPRVHVGGLHVERRHVVKERLGVHRGDVLDRAPLLGRGDLELVLAGVGVGDRVAHVGDVDNGPDRDSLPAQRAAQRVGEHVGAHVAQVRERVDGRPAAVQAHDIGGRREVLDPPPERVVEPELMTCHPSHDRGRLGIEGAAGTEPATRKLLGISLTFTRNRADLVTSTAPRSPSRSGR